MGGCSARKTSEIVFFAAGCQSRESGLNAAHRLILEAASQPATQPPPAKTSQPELFSLSLSFFFKGPVI